MAAQHKKVHGQPCPYCKRPMNLRDPNLRPTRDHVVPRSRGGREIIFCCLDCNGVKGNMMPDEWAAFMAATAGWWKMSPRRLRQVKATFRRTMKGRTFGLAVVVPPELVYGKPAAAVTLCDSVAVVVMAKHDDPTLDGNEARDPA